MYKNEIIKRHHTNSKHFSYKFYTVFKVAHTLINNANYEVKSWVYFTVALLCSRWLVSPLINVSWLVSVTKRWGRLLHFFIVFPWGKVEVLQGCNFDVSEGSRFDDGFFYPSENFFNALKLISYLIIVQSHSRLHEISENSGKWNRPRIKTVRVYVKWNFPSVVTSSQA